jgi:hypothetical protein
MKVLFVIPPQENTLWESMGNTPHAKVRAMPCQVVSCTYADEANKIIDDMDVFFYSGSRYAHSQSKSFQIPKHVLTVNYDGDPYRGLNWDFNAAIDLVITPVISTFWHYRGKDFDLPVYWSPGCCNLGDFDSQRDIDVLFWGRVIGYPFRISAVEKILAHQMGEVTDEAGCVYHHQIQIGDCAFKFSSIEYKKAMRSNMWGAKLYAVIARAKICVTSAHIHQMALGRFYENAAYGSLSVTNFFPDSGDLGFKHGETIWFTTEEKLLDDLSSLLNNDELLSKLRWHSWKLIEKRHTVDIRAGQLYRTLYQYVREKRSLLRL